MTKKIELNLGKSSLFRVTGFLSEIDFITALKDSRELLEKEATEAEQSVIMLQVFMKVFSRSENQVYELFADLSGVDMKDIVEMDDEEFYGLIESFLQAPLLKQAYKLYKKFNQ